MDSENEHEVYSRLSSVEQDQKALIELQKHQISVVKTALSQIQRPLQSFMNRQNEIARKINEIQNLETLHYKRMLVQEVISSLLLQIIEIEFNQQTFLDILSTARQGQIHPLLITPEALRTEFNKDNPQYLRTSEYSEVPYLTAELKTQRLQDKLVIRIILPIFNIPVMKLYQVRTFPVYQDEYHSIIPEIDQPYLAYNEALQEYVALPSRYITECKSIVTTRFTRVYLGPLRTPIMSASHDSQCEIHMLRNPRNNTTSCPMRVQTPPQNLFIKMHKANTWLYAFHNPQDILVSCSSQRRLTSLNGTGILAINAQCALKIGEKTIYPDKSELNPLRYYQPTRINLTPYDRDSIPIIAQAKAPPKGEAPILIIDNPSLSGIQTHSQALQEITDRLENIKKRKAAANSNVNHRNVNGRIPGHDSLCLCVLEDISLNNGKIQAVDAP